MATLQDYAKLPVFYNGTRLLQITSVKLTTNSGQQRVDLLNEGLGGFTPGSGDVTIDIGFVIPIGGPEADYQQDCQRGSYVTLQVGVGRVGYIGRGKIMNCDIGQSVNASSEGSFQWVGQTKPLE